MNRFALAALASVALAPSALAVSINEIQPNPTGADNAEQQIELLGVAGSAFSGVLLSIESDPGGSLGLVDRLSTISGTFDANGLLVVDINDLENPSNTLVLLDSFSGAVGDDIDIDNDGVADTFSGFGTVLDAVGIADNTGDEMNLYAGQFGGVDLAFSGDEPQLIFRDAISLMWFAINDPAGSEAIDMFGNAVSFDAFNFDPSSATFGDINPTLVPVPAAAWLFASALATFGFRRKRA
ncbi:MAG: hypothetical protein AB8G16_18060 [Gammaproteobacteria bacterium]